MPDRRSALRFGGRRLAVGVTAMAAASMIFSACSYGGPGVFADHLHLDTTRVPCDGGSSNIEILQEPPTRPYRRVAYVEAYASILSDEGFVHWDTLRSELCRQAAEVGADAIIELRVGGRDFSRLVEVGPIEVSAGGHTKKLTGVAIRFDSDPGDVEQPSAEETAPGATP